MKKLVTYFLALSVLLGSWPSYAGYAQLKPPPGWSQGMGAAVPGTAGAFNFGGAANGSVYKGTTVLTNAAFAVAGKVVTVPVSMRVAANAGTFAASFAFGNPALFTLLAAGSLAYQWFEGTGFQVNDGAWAKSDPSICTVAPCTLYQASNNFAGWHSTPAAAAQVAADTHLSQQSPRVINSVSGDAASNSWSLSYTLTAPCCGGVPAGTKGTDSGTFRTKSVPPSPAAFTSVGPAEFQGTLGARALPAGLPQLLPIPLPVEYPVFNPDPAYDPSQVPASRPMWIPTGDPVKQPNPTVQPTPEQPNPVQKPDVWTQPGVRVSPAPTTQNPWQVDVVSAPRDSASPAPVREPLSETDLQPIPNPGTDGKPLPADNPLTCGLPGTPACKIDESGTPDDAVTPFEKPKTDLDKVKDDSSLAIDKAATLQAPAWTFSFQLPTGCAPYQTGLRGVLLNICQYQSTIHDLMSMIWAGATFFCLVGMVGRTIRES